MIGMSVFPSPVRLALFMGFGLLTTPSGAVTLTNLDAEPFTWTVTERGERAELTVGAGQTVEFCTDGCFVIGPSGDRAALIGNEHLEIRGGRVRIK